MSNAKSFRQVTVIVWTLTIIISAGLFLYGLYFTNQFKASNQFWKEDRQFSLKESYLLSRIHNELGYGGLIHNFKNLVLRKDLALIPRLEINISRLDHYFSEYSILLVDHPSEAQALETLLITYNQYKHNFSRIKKILSDQDHNVEKIDSIVKINDKPALKALRELSTLFIDRRHLLEKESDKAFKHNLNLIQRGVLPLFGLFIYAAFTVNLLGRLRKASEFQEDILNTSSDPILVTNSDDTIIKTNPSAVEFTGYQENELIGMNFGKLVPKPYQEEYTKKRSIFFRPGEYNCHSELSNFKLLNHKGEMVDADIALNRIKQANGELVVINIRDTSSERNQQVEIAQRESMLNQAQSVAKLGCWRWELASDTLTLSDEAKRIYGYSFSDQRFSHELLSKQIPPEEREEVANAINESILMMKTYHVIHRIQVNEFTTRHVEQNGELTLDENGKVIAMLGIVADITEKFLAEKEMLEREAMLNQAQSVSKAGCWKWDLASNELTLSDEAKRIYGLSSDHTQFSLEVLSQRIPSNEREHVVNSINESVLLRNPYHVRHTLVLDKNTSKIVEQFGELTTDKEGKVLAMLGVVKDVTIQQETEYELTLAANVFAFSHEAIIVSDKEHGILKVNPKFIEITGYEDQEIRGTHPNDIISKEYHAQNLFDNIEKDLKHNANWKGDIWLSRKNTESIPTRHTISAVKDKDGNVVQYISIFSYITQEKKQEEYIRGLAHYCQLTKLPNRILFLDRLKQSLIRSHRNRRHIGILFIDLDRFKYVNDTLGHDAGDLLLQEISKRLKATVREQDTVSRLGGDEFTMILEDVQKIEDVFIITDKIIASVNEPVKIGPNEVVVGASIGISTYPLHGEDCEALLKCADTAMYHAKENGKNRAMLYEKSMSISASKHFNLEHKLRKAVDEGQMELYFQPQVNLETNTVSGCEALVRWNHPEEGIISPIDFIPLAEETGLIIPLGTWVLEEALKLGKKWHDLGLSNLSVCVNVSSKQLAAQNFHKLVEELLNTHRFPAEYLVLEVTESVVIDNPEETIKALHYIRNMKIKLALDDFGTGYSSLSYLKKLPINKVKIDRAFIRDMNNDKDDEEIVKTIIAMSNVLGLQVVAEGAETLEQVELIKQLGGYEIQGFYFSKPLQEQAFLDFTLKFNNLHLRMLKSS